MEVLILAGILSGALFFGFFLLGYQIGKKQPKNDENKLVIKNEDDLKKLTEFAEWFNYKG